MNTDSENRSQIRKKGDKILLYLSNGFAILLVVFALWVEWTIDQDPYLLRLEEVAKESAENGVITEFYKTDLTRGPDLYYARIRCTHEGQTDLHSVVRARADYIGKTIPVKRLPSGRYIRSTLVLTHRFAICLERCFFICAFIAMGKFLQWMKKR